MKNRSVVAWGRERKYERDGFRRGTKKLLEVMVMFTVFIMVVVS